jgi:SAM-dependent methyltransferase
MTPHPATFTDALLPRLAAMLQPVLRQTPGPIRVLDPFAGTGKIVRLREWLPQLQCHGYEIEDEWAQTARAAGLACYTADSRRLHYPDSYFDAVCTSPTYANRMADHHEARDGSPRHTYRHALGRPLSPGNSGMLQWGDAYRALHTAVYREVRRVLRPGGLLVLNLKDHIRHGERVPVTNWHAVTLLGIGFVCTGRTRVPCPGQRHGTNGRLRVSYETVLRFELRHP